MVWALGENWKAERLNLDWRGYFDEVTEKLTRYGLERNSEIIVGLSHEQSEKIDAGVGLLHIDGNHDFDAVGTDVRLYFPKLAPKAFVVFDDINWEGVKPHYRKARNSMDLVWETTGYGILRRS